MTAADRRFVGIIRIGVVLGLVFHVSFLAVFALLAMWVIAAFNLFIVAVFAVAILLVARGRLTTAFWLSGAEVMASVSGRNTDVVVTAAT